MVRGRRSIARWLIFGYRNDGEFLYIGIEGLVAVVIRLDRGFGLLLQAINREVRCEGAARGTIDRFRGRR
jgi:hypothetical protein